MTAISSIEDEALIPVENILVTLTNKGYIKRVNVSEYRTQNRGGVGIKGMSTAEEDFATKMINMQTHDYILFFSNRGKVYRMKGYEVPEYARTGKGLPIINLLPIDKEEQITSIISIKPTDEEAKYLFFVTKKGTVKRTNIEEFDNLRSSGKIAITLREDDELIAVRKTIGENEIIIGSSDGRMVRFNETDVRVMGRSAAGVRGIVLDETQTVVGGDVINLGQQVMVVTEKGYGKKTPIEEYRLTKRGSKGVKALKVTDKNGALVAFSTVNGDEDAIMITESGIIIRISLNQVNSLGRATQGVKLINTKGEHKVATVTIVQKEDEEETTTEEVIENNENVSLENNDSNETKEAE
jgi:DNA gyrase subunit A